MSYASLNIGSTPCDEECAQVGSEGYAAKARRESRAYINQLRRVYGPEPEGARLTMKAFPHDHGTYHEVVVEYDASSEAARIYAFKAEVGLDTWDDEALKELSPEPVTQELLAIDSEDAAMHKDRVVLCPNCKDPRDVEMDADYTYKCEGCQSVVKVTPLI